MPYGLTLMRPRFALSILVAVLVAGSVIGFDRAPSAGASSVASSSLDEALAPKLMPTAEVATRLHSAPRRNDPIPGAMSYHGGAVANSVMPVYLIIWGSDWGTRGHDANGYDTFSNDPQGVIPVLEAMYAGIGRNGERWSAVPTQYCSGPTYDATSCPADNASRIAYPIHGVFDLSHVFYDNAAPFGVDTKQKLDIRDEAAKGQTYFGSPANAQYVVLSPTGTHPNNFNRGGGFCGWHAWSAVYNFAYQNLPYVPDAGTSCGADKLGPGRPLDGLTATAGHEYQETITDPQTGWVSQLGQIDYTGWYDAANWENGDKCAWVSSGPAAVSSVTFSTGTFTQQTEWSNAIDGCAMTQDAVEGGTGANLSNPGAQAPVVGHSYSLGLQGGVTDGGTLSFDAGDLPAGLTINTTTGLISGTPTASGTSTAAVQARSTSGATATVFVAFTVAQLPVALANPGTTKATIGRTFTFLPSTTVAAGTPVFSQSGLPGWASLDASTGQITGTPNAIGTSSVTLTATANGQSDAVTFDLVVGGQVSVTAIGSKTMITGKATSIQVSAVDSANGALSFGAAGLPSGLAIDAASGLISGTPTSPGTGTATVTVRGGEDKDVPFAWTVNTSTITSTGPLSIQVLPGKSTTLALRASSNAGLPVTFSPVNVYQSSNCGLTLASNGTFTGVSDNYGSITIMCQGWQITASDGYGTTTLSVDVIVSPAIVNLKAGESTSLFTGKAASIKMAGKASGNAALTYSATGLPNGLSINATTGVISGTPTKAGTSMTHVVVRTSLWTSSDSVVKIVVAKPTITLTLPTSPSARRNQPTSLTMSAVDSAGEQVTFRATGLPNGLSINATTGLISGKTKSSVALGAYPVTVTVTDPGGASKSGTFSLQLTS